jgi:hypothetical protein
MGKGKVIVGVALVCFAIFAGWQVVSCELANAAFQEDLQDLSAQGGTRIGLLSASSEEDLRNTVIRKAGTHDIVLQPGQIIVEKQGTPEYPFVYIAADYKARVNLPGFSFELHFTPASKHM